MSAERRRNLEDAAELVAKALSFKDDTSIDSQSTPIHRRHCPLPPSVKVDELDIALTLCKTRRVDLGAEGKSLLQEKGGGKRVSYGERKPS